MNTLIIDYRTTNFEIDKLLKYTNNILKCPKLNSTYEAINGHPDIQFFITNSKLVIQKDINPSFLNKLYNYVPSQNIYMSNKKIGSKYPNNIGLNAVSLKEYFIHNLKHSDSTVLSLVSKKKHIPVKQGYTKCSTAIVSDKAIITSDLSIYNAVVTTPIDVLLIPPGDILLPGLNYGFIGGTCGLISEGTLAFFGNLKYYKYGNEVLKFLIKHDVKPVYLRNDVLIDRGSILKI